MALNGAQIKAYFSLLRPLNLALVALSMLFFRYFYLIHELEAFLPHFLSDVRYFLAVFSVLFTMAGGYIINDINDVKADKINKPEKRLIENIIPQKRAYNFYSSIVLLSITCAAFINIKFVLIVMASNAYLMVYSFLLKRIAVLGNLFIAFISAVVPFLAVWLDIQHIFTQTENKVIFNSYQFVIPFAILAFVGSFIREFIKDIEDVEGDKAQNAKTLPILSGVKVCKIAAGVMLLLTSLVLVYFAVNIDIDYVFYGLIILALPFLASLVRIVKAKGKADYHMASNYLKIAMLLTILFIAVNGIIVYDIF